MALAEITARTARLVKGYGYIRYKAVDNEGEPLSTLGIVFKRRVVLMFAYAREGWYDGDKTNKLRFTRKGRTLYFKRLAIRFKIRKEWRQE